MMMRQHSARQRRQGMTLIEVMVTIGILSAFFIVALGMYSKTYSYVRSRNALMTIVDESDRIMTYIGADIRNAREFLADYTDEDESHRVIAAFTMKAGKSGEAAERVIVYFWDADAPGRLVRSVQTAERQADMELTTNFDSLVVIPHAERLFEVRLFLQQQTADNVSRSHIISKYAMR